MVAPAYRYPDNETVPQYLRGKTAEDAAQLLQGLVEANARGMAQAQVPQQPNLTALGSDDYVTAAHLQQAQQQALSQVSPWLKQVADQQATVSYNIAKREHTNVFSKYEPEIIQVLQRVPRENWTLDVIENAVTFVKGKHVDELTADKVRALEQTMTTTMRSTGRAGLPSDSHNQETVASSLDKAPEAWRVHAKAVGITENEVWEFCRNTDTTPEEFFKQFGKGLVTDAIADVNYIRHSS